MLEHPAVLITGHEYNNHVTITDPMIRYKTNEFSLFKALFLPFHVGCLCGLTENKWGVSLYILNKTIMF